MNTVIDLKYDSFCSLLLFWYYLITCQSKFVHPFLIVAIFYHHSITVKRLELLNIYKITYVPWKLLKLFPNSISLQADLRRASSTVGGAWILWAHHCFKIVCFGKQFSFQVIFSQGCLNFWLVVYCTLYAFMLHFL